MANQIISRFENAWGFADYDAENKFKEEQPLLEDMADDASGARDIQPQKILRNRQYGPQPLMVRPEYSGDFLDKLREEVYKNRSADSLQDFSMPSDLTKYLPDTEVRDLQDEFYEIDRPGPGDEPGYKCYKDYDDRGWDQDDAPEISEDKVMRENDWGNYKPFSQAPKDEDHLFKSAARVINAFDRAQLSPTVIRSQVVTARYLMEINPTETELPGPRTRISKYLGDLEKSLLFTKTHGWRKPDSKGGVSVRLYRAEPRQGRWTFVTSSGKDTYTTIFQFIPKGNVRDLGKLHVRVSCTCPSWLYWGAQYNAVMEDYLYGKIRPKFTPPNKRDPTHRFLVCKHVLACIPLVSKYQIMLIKGRPEKDKIIKTPKVEVQKGIKEEIRIPKELVNFEKRPDIKEATKNWDKMTPKNRKDFIMGLDSPGAVSFMAHRFPDTATEYVVYKLKDMATHSKLSSFRDWAKRLLREIV